MKDYEFKLDWEEKIILIKYMSHCVPGAATSPFTKGGLEHLLWHLHSE